MNCKNCYTELVEGNFCHNCGAKVIKERLTLQYLFHNITKDIFGWDNKYFKTIYYMLVKPDILLKEYLDGVRKKYMTPFAYVAIGIAIATIVFNIYADNFLELQANNQESLIRLFDESYNANSLENESKNYNQDAFQKSFMEFLLRYFNIFSFFILPFYALVSKFTFWKENTYAEHLVTNAYIQGTTYLFSTLLFVLAVYISPSLYSFSIVPMVLFYAYVYFKLYNYGFKRSFSSVLKFILVATLSFIFIIILSVVIGIIIGLLLAVTGQLDHLKDAAG